MNGKTESKEVFSQQDTFRKDVESITKDELSDPKAFRKKTINLISKWFENADLRILNILKKSSSIVSLCKWILFMNILLAILVGFCIVKVIIP